MRSAILDLVDITGDATPNVEGDRAIGHQPAVVHELAQAVHCREVMRRGEFNDAFAVREEDHVSINDQSIRRLLGDRRKCRREVNRPARFV
jgi:hypothetical protein